MDKQKIGLYIIFFIGGVMALTGTLKIVTAAEAAEEFGNETAPYLLAVVQLLIAAAIFVPKTRLLGGILAASYIGGIIAFSWLHQGEAPIVGIVLNTVLYAGLALYRPFVTNNGE